MSESSHLVNAPTPLMASVMADGLYGSQAKSAYRGNFPVPVLDDVPSIVYKHFHRWKVSVQHSFYFTMNFYVFESIFELK